MYFRTSYLKKKTEIKKQSTPWEFNNEYNKNKNIFIKNTGGTSFKKSQNILLFKGSRSESENVPNVNEY